jgi:hypothetical protein
VLKPGGRFVYTVCHQSTDGRWHFAAPDSPRREDRTVWLDDDYFVRRAALMECGLSQPILSFHRPMRDYVAACKQHRLELRDIDEPELSEEALRELPDYMIYQNRRVCFSYVIQCVKTG